MQSCSLVQCGCVGVLGDEMGAEMGANEHGRLPCRERRLSGNEAISCVLSHELEEAVEVAAEEMERPWGEG